MDFAVSADNSVRLIAPFADMLNHASNVKQCHAYDPKSGDLSVLAGKNYEKGDQVGSPLSVTSNSRTYTTSGLHLLWPRSKQSPFAPVWLRLAG